METRAGDHRAGGPPSDPVRRHRPRAAARDHRIPHQPAECGGHGGHPLDPRPGRRPAERGQWRHGLHLAPGKPGPVREDRRRSDAGTGQRRRASGVRRPGASGPVHQPGPGRGRRGRRHRRAGGLASGSRRRARRSVGVGMALHELRRAGRSRRAHRGGRSGRHPGPLPQRDPAEHQEDRLPR